ncbi:MAG: patatin-like phospholipase family protein [Burkholderiales bacterium]
MPQAFLFDFFCTIPLAKNNSLIIRAGPRALAHIREHGLRAQDIEIIPGAAGGPKALGLHGLDVALFGEWLPAAPRVRHLIGSSIGAWRFASAMRNDAAEALRHFSAVYAAQHYPPPINKKYVTQYCRGMMHELFDGAADEILGNSHFRLSIIAARGRGMLARETPRTAANFVAAALANSVSRSHLNRFVSRTVFYDSREQLPVFNQANSFDKFHTDHIVLTPQNLSLALLASGSIPLVLEGVTDIPDAPQGTYWDGGIIDYHIHWPYHRAEGLVLYPHFTDKIIPGWLDKSLPWRKAKGEWLDNVVLVSPSANYLARLPYGKMPDRSDFKKFIHDPAARMRDWRTAVAESERLGQEFLDLTRGDNISPHIQPL